MAWSARIEGHEWRLYQGDRLAFCVDGLSPGAHVDVATIVNALNAYGPADVLMRSMVRGLGEEGFSAWRSEADAILSTKAEIRAVTTVEIGNVPDSGADE